MRLDRPRVRLDGQEVELETYRQLQNEDPLAERTVEQMLIGVSTRKYGRSLEPVIAGLDEFAVSRSEVSRRFVAKTQAQLDAALSRPLGSHTWLALLCARRRNLRPCGEATLHRQDAEQHALLVHGPPLARGTYATSQMQVDPFLDTGMSRWRWPRYGDDAGCAKTSRWDEAAGRHERGSPSPTT
ncbi:MAG: hypothetical protein HYZ28_28775 [Myxococcales bacterium]|nr:hypothetical protein [Myxococcales bacterium]